MIIVNVNCIFNDRGSWCTNAKVKKSLFGLGARCCHLYNSIDGECIYQEKYPKPKFPPSLIKGQRVNK